jgi:uncharacterized protein
VGDTDLVIYSLRKYLRLAVKGNPTVMLPLFAPADSLVVVKYGSHALRLAYQGYEIASTGLLTLPLPDAQRDNVLAVKRGESTRGSVCRDQPA